MMSLVLLGPCYRSPSKSFGELFEEKKFKLDALQAGLVSSVLLKINATLRQEVLSQIQVFLKNQ